MLSKAIPAGRILNTISSLLLIKYASIVFVNIMIMTGDMSGYKLVLECPNNQYKNAQHWV